MLILFIIFILSLILAFGMLLFRAWEVRTNRVSMPEASGADMPDLSFRHVEKNVLYLTKHIVQAFVLWIAKHWFILVTKTKKKIAESWPKLYSRFEKKPEVAEEPKKPSFFKKAIMESEAKIRRIKEKVKKEHE